MLIDYRSWQRCTLKMRLAFLIELRVIKYWAIVLDFYVLTRLLILPISHVIICVCERERETEAHPADIANSNICIRVVHSVSVPRDLNVLRECNYCTYMCKYNRNQKWLPTRLAILSFKDGDEVSSLVRLLEKARRKT